MSQLTAILGLDPSRQVLLLLFWNKYLSWSEDLVMVAPAVTKVEGHDVAGVGEHVDVSQVRRHRLDRNADSCLQPVNWSLFSRSGYLFHSYCSKVKVILTSISWLRSWILCCTARNSTWGFVFSLKFQCLFCFFVCSFATDSSYQKLLHPVGLLRKLWSNNVGLNGLVHLEHKLSNVFFLKNSWLPGSRLQGFVEAAWVGLERLPL